MWARIDDRGGGDLRRREADTLGGGARSGWMRGSSVKTRGQSLAAADSLYLAS